MAENFGLYLIKKNSPVSGNAPSTGDFFSVKNVHRIVYSMNKKEYIVGRERPPPGGGIKDFSCG